MHLPLPWALFLVLSFGLILGSFLNVCIYRMPRGESVVTPRSRCPHCRRTIPWYDNIPLLSFLWLRGRCRGCRRTISLRYPAVELTTALLSLAVYAKFGFGLAYLFYFVLLAAPLVAITFIDLEHRIIPDLFSLPGIISGLAATLLLMGLPPKEALIRSLGGIAAGGGSLFVVSWIYERLRHQEGIGMGDVKLAAMLGAFFGWKEVFIILLLSSLLGSVVGLILMVVFRKGLKMAIPYGPFLSWAALINLFFGHAIVRWYLGITGSFSQYISYITYI